MRGNVNTRCPFCNRLIEFTDNPKHVGFVTQKNLGFSTKQYFHLKCFEKAGRGKS